MLRKFPFLVPKFIMAVDGAKLNKAERERLFDVEGFCSRYSIAPRPGEIGCALSHQRCYQEIVTNRKPYVLILEDDIVLFDGITDILQIIEKYIRLDIPQIILLSGLYWYYRTSPLIDNYKLASIYDGYFAHAYIINQLAAQILIKDKPCMVADDWRYIRKKGIKVEGVLPHLVDQKFDKTFPTTINIETRKPQSLKWKLLNFPHATFIRFLNFIGYFEPKLKS